MLDLVAEGPAKVHAPSPCQGFEASCGDERPVRALNKQYQGLSAAHFLGQADHICHANDHYQCGYMCSVLLRAFLIIRSSGCHRDLDNVPPLVICKPYHMDVGDSG